MCLITKQDTPSIAKKDIICYKILRVTAKGKYKSYLFNFTWKLNDIYEVEIKISSKYFPLDQIVSKKYKELLNKINPASFKKAIFSYGNGFHSFSTIERAKNSGLLNDNVIRKKITGNINKISIFKCIIPKGSEYYEDETGLIVSNKMIINKEI